MFRSAHQSLAEVHRAVRAAVLTEDFMPESNMSVTIQKCNDYITLIVKTYS